LDGGELGIIGASDLQGRAAPTEGRDVGLFLYQVAACTVDRVPGAGDDDDRRARIDPAELFFFVWYSAAEVNVFRRFERCRDQRVFRTNSTSGHFKGFFGHEEFAMAISSVLAFRMEHQAFVSVCAFESGFAEDGAFHRCFALAGFEFS